MMLDSNILPNRVFSNGYENNIEIAIISDIK